MKKNYILVIGLLIILGGGLYLGFKVLGNSPVKKVASYSISSIDAPKIEIPENSFNFGKIQPTDVAKHEFKIKNSGKNPLIISSLVTSCHCASAILKAPGQDDTPVAGMHLGQPWTREIASGEEGIIEVIYEPAKMPVKGSVNRVIYLKTNDPNNTDPKLEINADVQ